MKEIIEFFTENRKAVVITAIITAIILIIIAVIIIPNLDHAFNGAWVRPGMNIFGGIRHPKY